jgi:hypothetical protein
MIARRCRLQAGAAGAEEILLVLYKDFLWA